MKRLIVEEVMKQEKAKLLLKNISFDVEEAEVVGIKCSIDESHLLFDLIEGEKPSVLVRKKIGDKILNKIVGFVETFINGVTGN